MISKHLRTLKHLWLLYSLEGEAEVIRDEADAVMTLGN